MAQEINVTKKQGFGSRIGLILASAGSAVGLGNLLFVTGRVDAYGALFFIPYTLLMLVIGLPLMAGEFALGRSRQKDVLGATEDAPTVGWMGIIGSMVVLFFYFILGGAVMMTIWFAFTGGVTDSGAIANYLFSVFGSGSAVEMNYIGLAICTAVFIGINWYVLHRGVKNGIELVSKYAMPALIITLLGLAVYALISGKADGDIAKLFTKWTLDAGLPYTTVSQVIAAAAAKAFLSLSLGMGIMITYGSYMQKEDNITKSSLLTILTDWGVVLIASVSTIMLGSWFAMPPVAVGILMILVLIAALTSSISLMEALVAAFGPKLKKDRTTTLTGVGVFLTVISVFGIILMYNGISWVSNMDSIGETYVYLLGGIVLSLYLGWRARPWTEITPGFFPKYYSLMTRFVIPAGLFYLWASSVGLVDMFLG